MQRHDLEELAKSTGFPRISIYIPTHRTHPEAAQDPIRLSNAMKEAETQLAEARVRRIDKLLDAARRRVGETMRSHIRCSPRTQGGFGTGANR